VGPVDLACLNAGVLTGELSYESYRRAVAVNVDGVVLGVLRLRDVMRDGAIVVTASLAGLTAMPSDPVYSLTKHAVVGFVRSMAPHLLPVRLNAVCPGIADTPMIDAERAAFEAAAFPLLEAEDVADAVWLAATSERSGECWFVQPGREPAPFRFPSLPGPRRDGERVGPPPS
jgi:NAD(P)-dependent dehydrogenase (short-subunit alcohol dehydrogenase family)